MNDSLEACEHLVLKSLPCEFCKIIKHVNQIEINLHSYATRDEVNKLEAKHNKSDEATVKAISQYLVERIEKLENLFKHEIKPFRFPGCIHGYIGGNCPQCSKPKEPTKCVFCKGDGKHRTTVWNAINKEWVIVNSYSEKCLSCNGEGTLE